MSPLPAEQIPPPAKRWPRGRRPPTADRLPPADRGHRDTASARSPRPARPPADPTWPAPVRLGAGLRRTSATPAWPTPPASPKTSWPGHRSGTCVTTRCWRPTPAWSMPIIGTRSRPCGAVDAVVLGRATIPAARRQPHRPRASRYFLYEGTTAYTPIDRLGYANQTLIGSCIKCACRSRADPDPVVKSGLSKHQCVLRRPGWTKPTLAGSRATRHGD